MDWNLFWTAFGAIGGTLGALATFVAVIVALWQTKFSYKKKVQLSFTDNITIVPENGNKFYHYVGVTITNIGNRDVVIQNWGFELDDGSQMLIVPDTSPLGRVLQVKLPYRLQIEEGTTLCYEKVLFHNALSDCLEKGKLKRNKKIKFYVSDSTTKKHYVLTNKTAEELLKDTASKNSRLIIKWVLGHNPNEQLPFVENLSTNGLLAKMIQSKTITQKRKAQPTEFFVRRLCLFSVLYVSHTHFFLLCP